MQEREVTFEGASVRLAGTLCLPRSAGRFPCVVFLHGSGPLDRDENMPGQRLDIFNSLAHQFASSGVASFRYDKRGCGSSSGKFPEAGLSEFVADAATCVNAISRLEFCSEVFLVGHSEGCILALLSARQLSQTVSGVVLLCPFMPPVERILLRQAEQLQRDVDALPPLPRFFTRLGAFGLRDPVAGQRALLTRIRNSTTDTLRIGLRTFPAKWMRELLAVDAEALREVRCPALLIAGQKDVQCDAADIEPLRRLLQGTVEAHVIADLTHVLRLEADQPSLLGTHKLLARPVAPEVLEHTAKWLVASAARIDTATLEVSADVRTVYDAFATPDALVAWLPPEGMVGRVLQYEFRVGGCYEIELSYPGDANIGKTTARTDVSTGRFLVLEPRQRIVQSVQFEAQDPSFAGQMTLTWFFEPLTFGTRVSVAAENVPSGISKTDHDAGLRSSLENLSRYVLRPS